MIDNEPFEQFCKSVNDLWPRCKTSHEQLKVHWGNVLARYRPAVVSAALTKCVSDYPDDTAPKWKVIFGYLAGRTERDGVATSEFVLLLNQSREASKGDHVPQSGNMSDEEAWMRWLRVLTQSVRTGLSPHHDARCVRLKNECELTGAECRARAQERYETSRWRQYLEEHGESIPAYLSM